MVTTYTDADLKILKNDAVASAINEITTTATKVEVSDSTKFSASGGFALLVDASGKKEAISYTGITGNELTGVSRDINGTGSVALETGNSVLGGYFAQHHNTMKESLKRLAAETLKLQDGTDPFTELQVQNTGTVNGGVRILVDTTTGATTLRFDETQTNGELNIGAYKPGLGYSAMQRFSADEAQLDFAADTFRGYSKRNIGNAASLNWEFNPDVANAGAATAYSLKCSQDLSNATAAILRVTHQASDVLTVRKDETEAVKLKLTSANAPLSLPLLGADPASPEDGDLWITNAGTTQLKVRSGGTTRAVTLS